MTTELESATKRAPQREIYRSKHKIRLVTATSLFDGHDAAINIMRRIAQGAGAEVIHLGHNRSVEEIVRAAIQEDVQGIAVTSYQGGHNEFFRYMYDKLVEQEWQHVRIFGGGGGVILPDEIKALEEYGIARIYSPDDGRRLGLQGMINDMLQKCDFPTGEVARLEGLTCRDHRGVARALSAVENHLETLRPRIATLAADAGTLVVLGITGTGGAGKSSLMDELVRRFTASNPGANLAILSVDPSRRKTGGALLGDRIRMNAIDVPQVFMRSLATRRAHLSLAGSIGEALQILRLAGFDLALLESTGIGQSDTEITEHADISLYVMTPEYGAATQLEKIDMLDYADLVAINKFDRRGAEDALRDVAKQYVRNRKAFEMAAEDVPVFGTIASQFNDAGVNSLYAAVIEALNAKTGGSFRSLAADTLALAAKTRIIPPERDHYLAEIVDCNRRYNRWASEQAAIAQRMYQLHGALEALGPDAEANTRSQLEKAYSEQKGGLDPTNVALLESWDRLMDEYRGDVFTFRVRGREIEVAQRKKTLSGLEIPKVSLPRFKAWGERLGWALTENLPGRFPFAAGVFPFKRTQEDPTRMFAGEGGPERTNKRFHYLSREQPAKRLSTAFDSVTLYGEDPHPRPDIYGKVGNAGVSVCSLDDAKRLYSGFDLADPRTSVSMTINGPAPMLLGFFLNAAIDQQCEIYIREQGIEKEVERKIADIYDKTGVSRPAYRADLPEGHSGLGLLLLGVTGDQVLPADIYNRIATRTLASVRGTVQADILKEDQAQNTCIFSSEFALRMMGDIQAWFIDKGVRNFYSVSISGYHIAEAGANPITQLAFTLANGFTYVEYYLSRGLQIDDFAPNLSFFFSNGVDPEYAVIGRVARRIWAKAIKHKYGGGERSQKLKYHIQTSGRSLHAQEISFNDIRTTLQALYAIYDNCNSLHTNAYDEAITTPTEESVRRAMAIQLIINKELGLAANENSLQGSFIIEELTDLVEEAVYAEFQRLSERGGVLGAMETMYQRGKIQEESIHYETLKSTGELPIVGVNTFLSDTGSPIEPTTGVMRSSEAEKQAQIESVHQVWERNKSSAPDALQSLKQTALTGGNTFDSLMEAVKMCSLGQISAALYEVGGQYRRSM